MAIVASLIESYYLRFEGVGRSFFADEANRTQLDEAVRLLEAARARDATVHLIGNGGSFAVAEHSAADLTKTAGLKAVAIGGGPMLTALSNDLGYEHAFERALASLARPGDLLVAISSSGASPNILNACRAARERGVSILTLSGFEPDNPLRRAGDVNLWVDCRTYGFVEALHGLLLHLVGDALHARLPPARSSRDVAGVTR